MLVHAVFGGELPGFHHENGAFFTSQLSDQLKAQFLVTLPVVQLCRVGAHGDGRSLL